MTDSMMPNARETLKVKIIGGKYVKKYYSAWLNPSLGDSGYTNHFMYLFIKRKKDSDPKAVRVKRENAILLSERAVSASYEEAVINQHPTIESKMRNLAKLLTRCDLHDINNMGAIFAGMIENAGEKLAYEGDDMAGHIITTFPEHSE